MSTRIRTLQDLRDAAATQTQTQTASNPTRSEGRTPAGETTQATAGNDAAPKQAGQVGHNFQSNVIFGGNQKAGKIKMGVTKEGTKGTLAPPVDTLNVKAIQTGNNIDSNVLHPGATQDVQELTFGGSG